MQNTNRFFVNMIANMLSNNKYNPIIAELSETEN